MELTAFTSIIQNFGALGILALMVWRLPQVITTINGMIQDNVKNVRDTQTEALNVFKAENDKVLSLVGDRFEKIEENLTRMVESNTAVVSELRSVANRVGAVEREKPN